MQLIKCFVTVFNVLVALIMAFFVWEEDSASVVGFGFFILLYVANTILIWWR